MNFSSRAGKAVLILPLLGLGFACMRAVVHPETAPPVAAQRTVHYQEHVRPLFDGKCAACHSCNEAPCQLKLTSAEGVMRGASRDRVYDGQRKDDLTPTRL